MDKNSETPSASQPKKLSLDSLIPDKTAVNTSLGLVYVRRINIGDWQQLKNSDLIELGKNAIQMLTSRVQNKRDNSGLSTRDIEALEDMDILALAPAIAKTNQWENLPNPPGLKELGEAVELEKKREMRSYEKKLNEMRASIERNYSFLDKSSLEKLKEQMSGLSYIRGSVSAPEGLKAAAMLAAAVDASSNAKLASDTLLNPIQDYEIGKRRGYEDLHMPRLTPPEETVLGKATLESAQNSRETSQRMIALVEVVGGLNQTLVENILPAWVQKIEGDQKHAELALIQAGKNLNWTKWAVVASIVASFILTTWQIYVAHTIDRDNSGTQRTTEHLLREQLLTQQKLTDQQAFETSKLRELIEKQLIEAGKLRNMLETKLIDQGQPAASSAQPDQ